ncbi:MAG: sugar transferase, partial [Clostridia bacterium]
MYERYIKRILDVVVSAISLVVASPLFLIVAIAIKLDSRGPVFFKQKRIGRGKSYFFIYK